MPIRLLHLEDSPPDAELVGLLIARHWPDCRIQLVSSEQEFRAALQDGSFDMILSDYTLPGFDGLRALAVAKEKTPATPFLFLSGTIGEERAVEALKRGATDYILKDRPTRLIPAMRQAFALIEQAQLRQLTEEKLRENEERFRQIAENVAELIALLDLDGRRIYSNPAHVAILGADAVMTGRDAFAEIHPEDRERARAVFAETIRSGERHALEYRLVACDGSERILESQNSVVRDGRGKVAHVLVLARDVTARREADVRLREQASLLDKARDAIIATDIDHRVAYWNASAERLYGWKTVEVFGRRLDEIGLGFDAARFAAARQQLFASGEWRGDFRLQTRSGETVLVESTWSLVLANDGRPQSVLAIDTDVTERKKLESQLLRAQRMESIGTLAGGIAHDLNNVLTPILLSIDMLASSAASEEDRALIEKTRASASHGAALVQQLLAFGRGADARRTRLNPAAVLGDLEGLVRQSLPPAVHLVVRPVHVRDAINADSTQFKQVLINLCLNARDAMPAGGRIEIAARKVDVDAGLARANPGVHPGAFLRISVTDTGTGIPPAIMDKIFDPFFTTKASGKGTGLGLSMVAGIMKSHGGFVQVESGEGRGTTFHLFFPTVSEEVPILFREMPAVPAAGSGETVLLIDDEPAVRDMLQVVLQRASYRVIAAADGNTGLAEFDRHRDSIGLVISDMMLPDLSGMDVVRELRRRAPKLPAIAISGMMASGAFDALQKLEPRVQCLAKPLAPAVLLAAVRGALAPVAAPA